MSLSALIIASIIIVAWLYVAFCEKQMKYPNTYITKLDAIEFTEPAEIYVQRKKDDFVVLHEYRNILGLLTTGPEGFAQEITKYNDNDDVVSYEYKNCFGLPTLNAEGFAKELYSYDENKNLVEQAFLDTHNKPILNKNGYSKIKYELDEQGQTIKVGYYGLNDELVTNKSELYAYTTREYDKNGYSIKERFFDPEGKLTPTKEGYAIATYRYNDEGSKTAQGYYDANEKPFFNEDIGFWYVEWEDDGNSRTHRTKLFLIEDGVVAGEGPYTVVERDQDSNGNTTELRYYDTDGKLMIGPTGFAVATWKYDEYGNLAETDYLGTDGKLKNNKAGYARVVHVIHNNKPISVQTFYDQDGNIVEQPPRR